MMTFRKLLLTCTVATTMTFSTHAEDYILATASTGGTFYPVGVALSTLVKVKLKPKDDIGLSAINSAGSGENIRLMRENEVQFGILQGLYGFFARKGTGPLTQSGPQDNIRSVTMLWQNVEQFIVNSDVVESGTVSDLKLLKGQKIAMGKKNSGTLGSNKLLLESIGVDIEKDYNLLYAGYGPSADALQNGQIIGGGFPGGNPMSAITKLFAAAGKHMTILQINDEQLKRMDNGRGLWTRHIIPAGTYPNQEKDVSTIAQPNFLAVNADVSEDDVYKITKTIYENLPFLNGIHKATKAMAIEKAIVGLPVPLHPGAAKYYQEVGISIPDNLIAK